MTTAPEPAGAPGPRPRRPRAALMLLVVVAVAAVAGLAALVGVAAVSARPPLFLGAGGPGWPASRPARWPVSPWSW
jgi:hypothetical protein